MQILNRELGRDRGLLDWRPLEMGIERFVVAQLAPSDAGELVGQCDRELVPVQPLRRRFEPRGEAVSGPVVRAHQENLPPDQQRA